MVSNDFCFVIEVEKESCIPLNGIVENLVYKRAVPNADIRLLNKCTGEVESISTDDEGKFEVCIDCGMRLCD